MSEKTDAWMPLYVGDYLASTGRLTTEGHGAYFLLILDYWRSRAALPDDNDQLAAITRLPLPRWVRLRPVIEQFFQVADGRWKHKRIELELSRAKEVSGNRSDAGKAGALARWQAHASANGKRMPDA